MEGGLRGKFALEGPHNPKMLKKFGGPTKENSLTPNICGFYVHQPGGDRGCSSGEGAKKSVNRPNPKQGLRRFRRSSEENHEE